MVRSANFEVFGRVQGVFFRKCTKDKADSLGICGWVRNTRKGTVEGIIQGTTDKMNTMKHWLREVGSPQSDIEKCTFTNEKDIDQAEFEDFSIKKTA
uniref:Acylphosphatase n=1 Tax=Amblyomma americanum TaxID=6943 RepID=A0A0C9SBP7_AMBAM